MDLRHCNATIGQEAGNFGFAPVECRQQVTVRTYASPFSGVTVGYCATPGHREQVERRFGPDETRRRVCDDCDGPVARYGARRCGECNRKDRRRIPLDVRLWAKIDKTGGPDACWLWTGSTSRGYGYISPGGRAPAVPAHRVSWELANGPIPDGLWVLHHCDNPPCVNPAHLFLGTVGDNNRDMFAKGRAWQQTHPELLPRGEQHVASVLTDAQVDDIRARFGNGETNQSALAREYGVGHSTVNRYIRQASVRRRFAEAQDPEWPGDLPCWYCGGKGRWYHDPANPHYIGHAFNSDPTIRHDLETPESADPITAAKAEAAR